MPAADHPAADHPAADHPAADHPPTLAARQATRAPATPRTDLVVIGLGYVGLPVAHGAVRAGLSVVGLDTEAEVVASLSAGRSHIDDLTDADVAQMRAGGFTATTEPAVLAEADAVVICVPTPLSPEGGPDLAAVHRAAHTIAAHLRRGMLVVLESTTYPGTTEEILRPILEGSGLVAGVDFHLAFSPERIDPGNRTYGMANTPKVIGGCTPESTERCAAFYRRFIDTVVTARGTREAEMAKLLENTYRHVNIALVNEMAKFCAELGVDIWDAIRCAATKPFGFEAFYPGPGVGGHCIPIDPNYLSYKVRTLGYPFRFVELAQEINKSMPAYVVRRIQDLLNEHRKALRGSRVLLLGVTYKPDIADQRESPASPVARYLLEWGAEVVYHDPYVPAWQVDEQHIPRAGLTAAGLADSAQPGDGQAYDRQPDDGLEAEVAAADITVLLTAHRSYPLGRLAAQARLLFDTRGVLDASSAHRL